MEREENTIPHMREWGEEGNGGGEIKWHEKSPNPGVKKGVD